MSYALPFKPGDKLLELGGGARPMVRPNADIRSMPTVDIIWDFNLPCPLRDGQFDGILCIYALEHLSWRRVRGFLGEVHRILAPGGLAVFVTSNTIEQIRKMAVDYPNWQDRHQSMLWGDLDYPENSHKLALGPEYAVRLFGESGFFETRTLPHPDCPTDMIIEARKSAAVIRRSLEKAG